MAKKFDLFVTDPDGIAQTKPGWAKAVATGTRFLAYLSWTEIGPDDPFLDSCHPLIQEAKDRKIKVLGKNPNWNSWIMDVANPDWQELYFELVADAVNKGYGGVYHDTTDGWTEIPNLDPEKEKEMCTSTVGIMATIYETYPAIYQMVNRCWDLLPAMKDSINHILVETVWHGKEGAVDSEETKETISLIKIAQACAPVTVLDYIPSQNRKLAKQIFKKATARGCGCTVVADSLTDTVVLSPIPERL